MSFSILIECFQNHPKILMMAEKQKYAKLIGCQGDFRQESVPLKVLVFTAKKKKKNEKIMIKTNYFSKSY